MEESNWSYYKDEKVREKIDKLLKQNAAIEASLGKDSNKKEYGKAKLKQERLFDKIKDLDPFFYKRVNPE